jgi:heme oxygenase
MSATEELRARTRDLHDAIEKVVPLLDPALTSAGYREYLEQLLPFYQLVEKNLAAVPNLRAVVEDLDERWKTKLLAEDLKGPAGPFAVPIESSFVPKPRNVPEALGCLYVLEGSTLGAQILVRSVQGSLGAAVEGRTHFLASYGSAVGEKWRELCASLNAALTEPSDIEAAVAAARSTFTGLHDWLVWSSEQRATVTP